MNFKKDPTCNKKIILQALAVLIKADSFFMKIQFKMLGKTMKRENVIIKKRKPSSKTSNLYKVDYKIQDTDGFQKIYMSHSRDTLHS